MNTLQISRPLVAIALAAAFAMTPLSAGGRRGMAIPNAQNQEFVTGNQNGGSPNCHELPAKANADNGLKRKCPALGSSSGIARGDFDGNGIADLAIGVPGEDLRLLIAPSDIFPNGIDRQVVDAGAVFVVYGFATDGLRPSRITYLDEHFEMNDNNHFGAALAAGDFNGDGKSDLAVGTPGKRDLTHCGSSTTCENAPVVGSVHIYYGGSAGLTRSGEQQFFATDFPTPQFLEHDSLRFFFPEGMSLTWGDFDGDTVGDLAIEGRPNNTVAPTQSAVVVLFGSKDPRPLKKEDHQLLVFFTGRVTGQEDLVLTSGDFNGDARTDLVVATPFLTEITIVNGSPGTLTAGARLKVSNDFFSSQNFGKALAVGDFNGDLRLDLAAAETGIGVHIFTNDGSGLPPTATQTILPGMLGTAAGGDFGAALAANKFNDDPFTDLAIGIPGQSFALDIVTATNAGAVSVIFGSPNGLAVAGPGVPPPQFIHQNLGGLGGSIASGDRFGSTLTAWNFGRSPQADLAIGVPFDDVIVVTIDPATGKLKPSIRAQAGAINVLYGTAGGLDPASSQFLTEFVLGGNPEKDDHFGAAVY